MSSSELGRRSGDRRDRRQLRGPAAVILPVLVLFVIIWATQTRPWATGPTLTGLIAVGIFIVVVVLARRRHHLTHVSTVAAYYTLPPELFDAAVAGLLERLGWSSMNVVGATADLGVNVLARDPDGRLAAIRCERWKPGTLVGSPVVQQLVGSVQIYGADRGVAFTTASFSAEAIDLARRTDVELVDGDRLADMAQQAGRPAA